MEIVTQVLADFAAEFDFGNLPPEVMHETKRILLDSVGCALGGLAIEKGKIAIDLAKRWNGQEEATVIGTGDRLSYFGASFANAELVSAMDYDVMAAATHITPFVLSAPLALAEGLRASGKQLICAIALGHEISARLAAAMTYLRDEVKDETSLPPVLGWSSSIFGGTAAAGNILKLDCNKMAHALGIAGHLAPAHAGKKFLTTVPASMTKYLMGGWMSIAELTAAFLAEMGFVGDITILDGEYGFWRYIGSSRWDPATVTEGLGQSWCFPQTTSYKFYPCCRVPHTALDCFISIIEENKLQPEDIDQVRVYLEPFSNEPLWRNNEEITSEIDAQFSIPFSFSVAAHRVKKGPEWQEPATYQNPRILDFMKKISLAPCPGYAKAWEQDPTSRLGRAEVVARGKTFTEERKYSKGTTSAQEPQCMMTDDELMEKFRNNASRILPPAKADKAAKLMLSFEEVEDVRKLLKLVTL